MRKYHSLENTIEIEIWKGDLLERTYELEATDQDIMDWYKSLYPWIDFTPLKVNDTMRSKFADAKNHLWKLKI